MQETTLSSGKKVKVRKGTAEDWIKAQKMTEDPYEMQLALIAVLVEIDGKKMTIEEVRKMPMEDFIAIMPLLSPATERLFSEFLGKK